MLRTCAGDHTFYKIICLCAKWPLNILNSCVHAAHSAFQCLGTPYFIIYIIYWFMLFVGKGVIWLEINLFTDNKIKSCIQCNSSFCVFCGIEIMLIIYCLFGLLLLVKQRQKNAVLWLVFFWFVQQQFTIASIEYIRIGVAFAWWNRKKNDRNALALIWLNPLQQNTIKV